MNHLKEEILKEFYAKTISDEVLTLIKNYEDKFQNDLDLYSMKIKYYMSQNKLEEACDLAKKAIKKNPYNIEIIYSLAMVCEKTNRYIEAYKYYSIGYIIHEHFQLNIILKSEYEQKINELERQIVNQGNMIVASGDLEKEKLYHEELKLFLENQKINFDILKNKDNLDGVIGILFKHRFGKNRFFSLYDDITLEMFGVMQNLDITLEHKIECLEVSKGRVFRNDNESDILIPIASPIKNVKYECCMDGSIYNISQRKSNHFNYYYLKPKTMIQSSCDVYFGKPIKLVQDPHNKKLVLNIFVDGLSEMILEEEDFKTIMPYTYQFFSKGIICHNAYTSSDWTYPSIATYFTGVHTTNHMMIHDYINQKLPKDITLLSEYFKQKGYQTAKIDGDWRSTPIFGYTRGMDRIIYQSQGVGMRAEAVVFDTIDHIELMKGTNQFIWMCVGDLHDVADNFDLKASVQASIPIEYRTDGDLGENSAKQAYNSNKRMAYIKQMKHIDLCLQTLYHYIEENYKEEEIIISLFGDHGQGYLVKPEEHFLAKGRSKVGMMFRSNYKKNNICKELISTCDYSSIMCSLAGISMNNEKIDGNLPVFFGGEKHRKYVLTESIHYNDPYMAALFYEKYSFYFTSQGKVQYDGRFLLGDYKTILVDHNGDEMNVEDIIIECTNIVLEHISGLLIY